MNPYEILGIELTSSKEEIKTAYRELAKKNHPDVNKGSKESEEKFKEISQAYEEIINSKSNNSTHFNFNNLNEMFAQMQAQQQAYLEVIFYMSLEELIKGTTNSKINYIIRDICSKCLGKDPLCKICNGFGFLQGNKEIEFSLPPSIPPGTTITFKNKGHYIPYYKNYGDLIVRIIIQIEDDNLEIQGKDMLYHLEYPIIDILKDNKIIFTIPGHNITIDIPIPNTFKQINKQKLRIPGKGLPKTPNTSDKDGDFYIELLPILPNNMNLTNKQKEILNEIR